MSELAREARRKMHEKAHRLTTGDGHTRIDASDYSEPEPPLNGGAQTGEKPVSKRAFRRGGHVSHAEGKHAKHHSGHAPRKRGGMANELINRNVKDANEEREGAPTHVGGYRRGGKAHKDMGGPLAPPISNSGRLGSFNYQNRSGFKHGGHSDEAEDRSLVKRMVKGKALTGKAEGGPVGYHVIDSHTGNVVGRTKNSSMASTMVDRRDNAYGAYRYNRQPIYNEADWGATHRDQYAPRKRGGEADPLWIEHAHMKKGALHKELDVPEGKKIPAKKLEKAEHSKNPTERRRAQAAENMEHLHHKEGGAAVERGGREAHAHGGKAGKGKMNVNIIIGAGHQQPGGMAGPMPMPPQGPPKTAPVPMPPPGAPPMGAMPMAMPVGMPPQQPPMPHKRGGRAGYPIDSGSGGGEARLEKIRAYGDED